MAGLLDLLAPWLQAQAQQPDRIVSAQPQTGANMSVDSAMARGMPQQSSYDQQLQDPNQWNISGQAQVPDYSRITTPGNPGGPSYNANYNQTAYPGSTTVANPQASLLPPGSRGLLMAANTAASGSAPTLTEMIKWLKQLQKQKQSTSVNQQMQPWAQPNTNPGAVKPEPPMAM